MKDLINGILPVEGVTAEQAWEVYNTMDEFANVVFDQFKEWLQDHRKQVGDNKICAATDLEREPSCMTDACFPGSWRIAEAS
jgi:hypothetical protein